MVIPRVGVGGRSGRAVVHDVVDVARESGSSADLSARVLWQCHASLAGTA